MEDRRIENPQENRPLDVARERLHEALDAYIEAEAAVRELEQGYFRVVIFGSARIQPDDATYQLVYDIAHALAARGIDIVTGGGPGLMEAANRAVLDVTERESRSYGLLIELPALDEPENKHLDIKSSHQRFSSRLDEFMRLSNAVIVAPGGIGTLLELFYVWQMLQVSLINDRPLILVGREMWGGLIAWMQSTVLTHRYISPGDFRWITVVDTADEAITLIGKAHDQYRRAQHEPRAPVAEVDRAITEAVTRERGVTPPPSAPDA